MQDKGQQIEDFILKKIKESRDRLAEVQNDTPEFYMLCGRRNVLYEILTGWDNTYDENNLIQNAKVKDAFRSDI
jgi:hypothetical protein